MIIKEGWPYKIPKGEFPKENSRYPLVGCGHFGKIVYVSDDRKTIGVECNNKHYFKDLCLAKEKRKDGKYHLPEKRKPEKNKFKKKTKPKEKGRIIFLIEV